MLLVTYDSSNLLQGLPASLAVVGVTCLAAENLQHARELIELESPIALFCSASDTELQAFCELCSSCSLPLFVVSSVNSALQRVQALQLGVHRYYISPFSHLQVIYDLGATRYSHTEQRLHYAGFSFDVANLSVWYQGVLVIVSAQQFRALLTLARSVGMAVSRLKLSEAVWGDEAPESSNALDALIHRLRQRLPVNAALRIQSIYGIGYRLAIQ